VVLYPRYGFDLPILALDVVLANGRPTLAIADACPVRDGNALPAHYAATMDALAARFLGPEAAGGQRRAVPEWGAAIFSDRCVCITPSSTDELLGFIKYAVALTRAHLMYSALLQPVAGGDRRGAERRAELLRNHARFCDKQLENEKTRRVLAAALGAEVAEAYMRGFMFDFDPEGTPDAPPAGAPDAGLRRFVRHMGEAPDDWVDAERYAGVQAGVDAAKAGAVLTAALSGSDVSAQRLEWAMAWLYAQDAAFAAAVDALLPDAPARLAAGGGGVGPELAARLLAMIRGGGGGGGGGAPAPAAPAGNEKR